MQGAVAAVPAGDPRRGCNCWIESGSKHKGRHSNHLCILGSQPLPSLHVSVPASFSLKCDDRQCSKCMQMTLAQNFTVCNPREQYGGFVQVVTWVPQNDVLAHPHLKLFLSHCGVNSMYEVRTPSTWLPKATVLTKCLIHVACDALPCVLLKLHSHKEEGAAQGPSSAESMQQQSECSSSEEAFLCRQSTMESLLWRCPSSGTSPTMLTKWLPR